MRLKQLIHHLEHVENKDTPIYFDFCYTRPCGLDSWRCIYAELALEWTKEAKGLSVGELLELCKNTIGKTFQGYKGGDFTMNEHTKIWVDNYSECTNTALTSFIDTGYSVILETRHQES